MPDELAIARIDAELKLVGALDALIEALAVDPGSAPSRPAPADLRQTLHEMKRDLSKLRDMAQRPLLTDAIRRDFQSAIARNGEAISAFTDLHLLLQQPVSVSSEAWASFRPRLLRSVGDLLSSFHRLDGEMQSLVELL